MGYLLLLSIIASIISSNTMNFYSAINTGSLVLSYRLAFKIVRFKTVNKSGFYSW